MKILKTDNEGNNQPNNRSIYDHMNLSDDIKKRFFSYSVELLFAQWSNFKLLQSLCLLCGYLMK